WARGSSARQTHSRTEKMTHSQLPALRRGRATLAALCLLSPLACGGGSPPDPDPSLTQSTTEASSTTCPVSIQIPSSNEAVGQSIQLSVRQSCTGWTKA